LAKATGKRASRAAPARALDKPVPIKGYPYAFYIALDGNGVNGLEGLAGVCLFLFDPAGNRHAYKIVYYDGIAGGHAVSVNPSGTVGYLGNSGQHLLFYDAHTLTELERISTLQFETARTSLQGSTHVIWLNNEEIVTPIGEHFYAFRLGDLENPQRLARHGVKLPHGMKRTASGRYVVYGSMDNPADGEAGEARHVGIWDRQTDRVSVLELPTTCWHVAVHPTKDIFYAVSFRVMPQDYRDYHDWGMAFRKEYAFEIDARAKKVVRHWAAGREIPAHINSDITLSDRELIFCNGGSQSIVAIELESFARYRIIDERPDLAAHLARPREVATQVYDIFARGNFGTNSHLFLSALRISRFSLLDSIYACQLSADQSLLFTANRGLNCITVYDYPAGEVRIRIPMPELQAYMPSLSALADPRLGFHHSVLIG
jgi:hypothetical protein